MDKKQASPELLQAELLPTQGEEAPANPPSRKRQVAADSDDDKPQPKRARLTRKNLAQFNKMGKKKATDPTDESKSTKTTSTTSSGFAEKARKNGILPPLNSKPPKNLEDIRKRYAKSRATASPPGSVYEHYAHRIEKAGNEATVAAQVSRHVLKEYDDEGYTQSFDRSFTGFPDDVGFNDGLSAPQPDFVEGLEIGEYDPVPVDDHIPGAALYKDDPYSLVLPHVAGEWKGPSGNMGTARLQGAYDGAALVFARNQALSRLGKPDPPGHAEVTTFTTDGTTLDQYAHYAEESEDGTTRYHQYRVKSTNLIDSHEDFRDGYKHLRNAQDHARNQSYALRDDLREHWKQQRSTLQPITEGTSLLIPDSQATPYEDTNPHQADYGTSTHEETVPYEDEGDYEVVEHQPVPQPTPPASSKHKSSKTPSRHSHHSHHSHTTPHSSKAPSSTHSSTHSSGGKRKASSSQSSHGSSGHVSKHKSYWKKDAVSGRYYHRYSDGTVSWLDDEEDERD
ncbi:hypothetical protein SPI_03406 [Niveomyces insectorum RCEF 264]|uniref:DUF7924 domain-containing protein n=1 Tax=Niveomyces insectorum RCEF 264 TaxID=1081102 RepID=A0A167W253_9HYPO|nr:hypothetical protein SPI_03406 [Niveomyces insectorum RCEF 264]